MAKSVGKEGKVFAIDVREGALESVRGSARIYSVLNIETIKGNLEKEGGVTARERILRYGIDCQYFVSVKTKV